MILGVNSEPVGNVMDFFPFPARKKLSHLKSEDHVELLALKPGDGVGVLGHGQTFPTDPKNESSDLHEGESLHVASDREHDLSEDDEDGEDDRAESDAENGVHEVAAHDGQDHVGPGVPGVQVGKVVGRDVHRVLDLSLQRAGVVEAEVGAESEQAHQDQGKNPVTESAGVAKAGPGYQQNRDGSLAC